MLVWILYAVIRKSPRRWWLYFWLAAVPLDRSGRGDRAADRRAAIFQVHAAGEFAAAPRRAHRAGGRRAPGLEIPQSRMFEMNASAKLKVRERLRLRTGRDQARGRLGHHHPAHDRGRNPVCLRPRNGPLRFGPRARRHPVFLRRAPVFSLSRLSPAALDARALGRKLGHPRRGRSRFASRVDLAAYGVRLSVHARSPMPTAATWSIRPTSTASK